ncbi:hypothetical protein N7462_010286 [Penicillium macrosclerotiorum]|uniref:uncharacterized protein n=1 Tax=Penicillium macrosclerotiorum TaxID=303699 RepID=UPI0025494806|nr:uncharacterized protein N7462_010286 [Penicillium macrosclerotiorum]KAJ5669216.1 hypothetical protein N7462_010286 [Penicillium macrosclerotiorum]
MPRSVQSVSPPPRRRRALQERSSAHTNERSPTRSLRMVRDKEDVEMNIADMADLPNMADIYTATPFPTKPEQILLPIPGKGQRKYISDTGFSYTEASGSATSTWSSPVFSQGTASSPRDHSVGDTWDVSSTVDTVNSPPQMWDDPTSSKSSLPELPSASLAKPVDYGSDDSDADFSDDELIVLPTATPTIKAVVSEPPTSPKSIADEDSVLGYSSPNVERIGAPSSPNFVTLDNSSVNFLPPRISQSDSEPRSNSLSSWNSRGTAVRHAGAAPWIYTVGSSEQLGSVSPSLHSSPPLRSVASFCSITRHASGSDSRSRSATSSSRSLRSVSDIQAAIDSGVNVQFPRIRAPSSSSSRADTSVSTERDFTPGPVSGRWNPHLSRVSSVWSAEELSGLAATAEGTPAPEMTEPTAPAAAALNQKTSRSTVWLVNDPDEEERLDSLTNLPNRNGFPSSLSSGSKRSNSMRSIKRPGTGSSTMLHILPTWAKIYYRADAIGLNPTLTMIDASRPSSARPGTGNSSVFSLMPTPLNIPRPRSSDRPRSPPELPCSLERPERVRFVQRRIESDPLDPRAHWVPDPELENGEIIGTPRHRLRHSWSPHLYTDRRGIPRSTSAWIAPSLDSTNEPVFGRRNIQVYSFCIGFVLPLAWIIASFLPLPPQPKKLSEMMEVGDDVELALESQLLGLQQRRHDNARWWRNLNRWMISLGVVIIVIIIVLSVIGTTTGF